MVTDNLFNEEIEIDEHWGYWVEPKEGLRAKKRKVKSYKIGGMNRCKNY